MGKPEQFKLLDDVVRNTIHSFNVQQVNILDLEGNIIYSNQPQYIRRVAKLWKPFQIAASGGHASLVGPAGGLFRVGGGGRPGCSRPTSPCATKKRLTAELGAPHAVFEITLNIDDDFREVWGGPDHHRQHIASYDDSLVHDFAVHCAPGPAHNGPAGLDMEVRLKEQLNQAERLAALGRMVAGVAHEIRNPLGIVRSTAELLGSRVDPAQIGPGPK